MRIKVLWIDDDYKKQTDVIGDAEQDGLDLIPFESHEEGIEALMKDKTGFHAVILDAKVKNKKSDTKTGLEGLTASRDRLIEINNQGIYLPYFIYTGQPDYMSNEMFSQSYGEYFIKGLDNQKLFDSIKEKVENKEEYKVHAEYKKVFEVCNKHFDPETKKVLTRILISTKQPFSIFDDELYFTQVRIILEKLFRVANVLGLLHDKCLPNGKVNLTDSSLFLSGEKTKHMNVLCTKKHFPKIISDAVKNILFTTGAASHTTDPNLTNHIDLKEYRQIVQSPYLLFSLTYQLIDVIIWFGDYVKANSNYATNVGHWIEIQNEPPGKNDGDWINGKVTRIAENGWGTFKPNDSLTTLSIPPKIVADNSFKENDPIKVKTEPSPDGAKTFIKEISRL